MLYRRAGGPVQGGRHPAPGPAHSGGRGESTVIAYRIWCYDIIPVSNLHAYTYTTLHYNICVRSRRPWWGRCPKTYS